MATQKDETELVTVRVPVSLLSALRLACQATGRTMSAEIRQGIQIRVEELKDDPEVKEKMQERVREMQALYGVDLGSDDRVDSRAPESTGSGSDLR